MSQGSKNLSAFTVIELQDLSVNDFHPLPDGRGEPTEVHVTVTPKGMPHVMLTLRLKSRRPLDSLINALELHGKNVFGERS